MGVSNSHVQEYRTLSHLTSEVWFALLIADQIEDDADLVHLAMTSKRHYGAIMQMAFRKIDVRFSEEAVKKPSSRLQVGKCALQEPNREHGLDRSWVVDHLSGHAKLNASVGLGYGKAVRSVRLSGWCYPPNDLMTEEEQSQPIHLLPCFQALRGLTSLREFTFAMDWEHFDGKFIELLNCESLTSLDVPFRLPSDVSALATGLERCSKLRCLKLRHLPADWASIAGFSELGKALRKIAGTLEHLTIELASFNRPSLWDMDDFIPSESSSNCFRLLFPLSSRPRHEAHLPAKATFNLKTLRLKHFSGISKESFAKGGLFESSCLQSLALSRCTVEPGFWQNFASGANSLLSIKDIDYDIFDREMVAFLSGCQSLRTLCLVRPRPFLQLSYNIEGWYTATPLPKDEQPELCHEGLLSFVQAVTERTVRLETLVLPWPLDELSTRDAIRVRKILQDNFKVLFERRHIPRGNFTTEW